MFLPFGLDPARTPVMGSYGENAVAAKATSSWYQLPPRSPDRPLVTVAAAIISGGLAVTTPALGTAIKDFLTAGL